MEFITANIPLNCKIYDTGDWHVGPHGFDEKALDKMIAEVKADKNARMILKGDLIDAITTNDKRFSAYSQDIKKGHRTPDDHLKILIRKLMPIKKQIITALIGNHEMTLADTTDLIQRLCEALDIPWGGYTCIVTFKNKSRKKHLFKGYFTHGRIGFNSQAKDPIQAEANMMASLKKNLEKMKVYDCVYMSQGHAHKIIIVHPTITKEVMLKSTPTGLRQEYKSAVRQNMGEISPENRFYVCSGSFLKTFAEPGNMTYAEMAQYGPAEIGCAMMVVNDGAIGDVVKRLF